MVHFVLMTLTLHVIFPYSVFAFWSLSPGCARHPRGEHFCICSHRLQPLNSSLPFRFKIHSSFLNSSFPDNPYLRLRLDQFRHSCLCWPLSLCLESGSHACPLCWPLHAITVATQLLLQQRNTQDECPARRLAHPSPQALCSHSFSSLFHDIMTSECYKCQCVLCPSNVLPVEDAQKKPYHSPSMCWILKCLF